MGDFEQGVMEYHLTIKDFHKITRTFELESIGRGTAGPDFKLYNSEGMPAESNNILEVVRIPDKDSPLFLQDYTANRKQLDKIRGTDQLVNTTSLKSYSASLSSDYKSSKGVLHSRYISDFTGLYLSGYFKIHNPSDVHYKSYWQEHIRFGFEKVSVFSSSIQSINFG